MSSEKVARQLRGDQAPRLFFCRGPLDEHARLACHEPLIRREPWSEPRAMRAALGAPPELARRRDRLGPDHREIAGTLLVVELELVPVPHERSGADLPSVVFEPAPHPEQTPDERRLPG